MSNYDLFGESSSSSSEDERLENSRPGKQLRRTNIQEEDDDNDDQQGDGGSADDDSDGGYSDDFDYDKHHAELVENLAKQRPLFLTRWNEQDRHTVTRLLREFGVATYAWRDSSFPSEPRATNVAVADLVGAYDILFCYGEPNGTDQGWTDGRLARTVRCGSLTLEMKPTTASDYFFDEGLELLHGSIIVEKTLVRERDSDGWGWTMQMSETKFRQVPEDYFGLPGLSFCLLEFEGVDAADEYEVRLQVLQDEGSFWWTPNEQFDNDLDDPLATTHYHGFMHDQVTRRYRGERVGWSPEASWLVNHMEIPSSVAWLVSTYLQMRLPAPFWEWKEGDLWIKLSPTAYATAWSTHYIARRRKVP